MGERIAEQALLAKHSETAENAADHAQKDRPYRDILNGMVSKDSKHQPVLKSEAGLGQPPASDCRSAHQPRVRLRAARAQAI